MRSVVPMLHVMTVVVLLHTALHAQEPDPGVERGAALYQRLCVSCHGEAGAGDGPMASLLDPTPRDFGLATFHVVSTNNRIPSDDDLLDTLRLGMVGTAMPGWSHLPEEDLLALVAFIRESMALRKVSATLRRTADRNSPRWRAALEEARAEVSPGAHVDVGAAPPSSAQSIERGRAVWEASCAECHGDDGRGGQRDDLVDIRGAPSRPRDMTRGLFRGSDEPVELARRITLGMPGTAMPAFDLPPEELWAVVHYVRSLVTPGAQQDMLQMRRTIVAPRVEGPLTGADSVDWQFVPQVRLPLMPFVWDEAVAPPLRVQMVHDGSHFAVRVRWAMPAAEAGTGQGEDAPRSDLILKLTTEPEPPLVSAHGEEVRLWRWLAPEDGVEGASRSSPRSADDADVRDVVFIDGLDPAMDGEPPLRAGETVRLQLILRAGGPETRSMTLWHAVELAP